MEEFEVIAIRYKSGKLEVLDQTKLPDEEIWLATNHPDDMCGHIKRLSVRGAPLIGVAAALALADYAKQGVSESEIKTAAQKLRESRPTAVNLMWAIDRMLDGDLNKDRLLKVAQDILHEDIEMCERMAQNGSALIKDGDGILTHCNTGALATPGLGTALAVITRAHQDGKKIHVYVDETRPLLQGGRLTTWELEQRGIPYTLICDNMAATLMRQGKIQRVFLGSDRVALNGDFANKIGTYSVAVLAKHHGVDFHPVAPFSTVDLNCKTGADIPIEERDAAEVRGLSGACGEHRWSPKTAQVWNPAFDVTPVEFVTSLVLDRGIFTKSDLQSGCLAKLN